MVFHVVWLVSAVYWWPAPPRGTGAGTRYTAVCMVFQGGFMVIYGFWLVSMGFQGGFIVFHGF